MTLVRPLYAIEGEIICLGFAYHQTSVAYQLMSNTVHLVRCVRQHCAHALLLVIIIILVLTPNFI